MQTPQKPAPIKLGSKVTVLRADPDQTKHLRWRTIGRGVVTALCGKSARVLGSDGDYPFHELFAIKAPRIQVVANELA